MTACLPAVALGAVLGAALGQTPVAGPVHFAREEVALRISAGSVEVSATYHFMSSSDRALVAEVFYPFPIDSTQTYPDSVLLSSGPFQRRDSGIAFLVRLLPQSEDSFSVYYRQPLLARRARYIVTTTRRWGRAIDRAQFTIAVPKEFRKVRVSFRPDSSRVSGSTRMYYFTRRNFWPDKDVVVTWK